MQYKKTNWPKSLNLNIFILNSISLLKMPKIDEMNSLMNKLNNLEKHINNKKLKYISINGKTTSKIKKSKINYSNIKRRNQQEINYFQH